MEWSWWAKYSGFHWLLLPKNWIGRSLGSWDSEWAYIWKEGTSESMRESWQSWSGRSGSWSGTWEHVLVYKVGKVQLSLLRNLEPEDWMVCSLNRLWRWDAVPCSSFTGSIKNQRACLVVTNYSFLMDGVKIGDNILFLSSRVDIGRGCFKGMVYLILNQIMSVRSIKPINLPLGWLGEDKDWRISSAEQFALGTNWSAVPKAGVDIKVTSPPVPVRGWQGKGLGW